MLTSSLARYTQPVPRYTSYPTAPHFHDGIDGACYARWLGETDPHKPVSLYLHVPFCDRLCWFCGCHTKQVRRYDPVDDYLDALGEEIALAARILPSRRRVSAVHFGGGSPTVIEPEDIGSLRAKLDGAFDLDPDCEISVEIDPRNADHDKLEAWHRFGITRASLGIQDFDPDVQRAINRPQSFEQTQAVVGALRNAGIGSINLDILYGLPLQTTETLRRTIDLAVSMRPNRIALFGYAHVPWVKKHQSLIDQDTLPGPAERFDMASGGAAQLVEAGYIALGLDHFADQDDNLATAASDGRMRRNFQGYTTDDAETLIGFGASSIGRLPQGYVQNSVSAADYIRKVRAGELPTMRGFALSPSDRIIGRLIESLMCNFSFSLSDLKRAFGAEVDAFLAEVEDVAAVESDVVHFDGDVFSMKPEWRPFVRTIASRFDRYLATNKARHSAAV
ncbi:oxygen-independent coproporphyrinogen III oxidase [Rhizobium tropici]|uniref:Coproporphyrinogen-III oxidase n=1 Tax=Rhizobium tropici TaxID=398 RepID=A0A329YH36_RHITR|nr:oxygen-independent coproporphyrinogen III oxidase [Rhizobium tropici]MBB3291094.1 oxygen-independent coproporphyrinogen-3 oxidase [Rhizobium sp. BK252]MBB3405873.1 oxygen-independent coproporphyrinogen-3 oxidase [Rhizobium sp. BK289]MBB3418421.1 oxygen-independent coproporphyrinogen-3 oxidase [Rhizobium sp. BK284]MBB3486299.1 oxygen-independent coproporphyrinogen-3 oxidase [Rhizobium sp. BK347]RAX43211.1 oxygen-independent coproporphyrinogen III oxidase [Rhizobium tropici]